MKKKKVGILGGSFDPVHFGHINLAISLKEACDLNEVLFVPARISPFKTEAPPVASSEHRLNMLKLAISGILEFRLIDWELDAEGPSYSIDTVRKLSEDPSLELHLLIADDQAGSFHLWKEAEELSKLAPPLIGMRRTSRDQKGGVKMPVLEISSTFIRERLSQKKYCGHLVPASVLDYIARNNLYS